MLGHVLECLVEGLKHRHLIAEQKAERMGQQAPEYLGVHQVGALPIAIESKVVLARDPEARADPSKLAARLGASDAHAKP